MISCFAENKVLGQAVEYALCDYCGLGCLVSIKYSSFLRFNTRVKEKKM